MSHFAKRIPPVCHRALPAMPSSRGYSRLTLANTGPVISPADAQRIFQPFQRLNDRASHDGSGLGLTIVASIAAIHGGIATADPRIDGGLSVTVTSKDGTDLLPVDKFGTLRRSTYRPHTNRKEHRGGEGYLHAVHLGRRCGRDRP
jgi:hypothetical protein